MIRGNDEREVWKLRENKLRESSRLGEIRAWKVGEKGKLGLRN